MADLWGYDESGRCRDGRSSRAERLEIFSLVAAVGPSECSAWIIPMLEHDGADEYLQTGRLKC